MPTLSLRKLKQMVRCLRPGGAASNLMESLDKKELAAEDFSVRDLFEAFHEDGAELLREIGTGKSGGRPLMEAAQAVDTQAFTGIIGQIVFNKVKEAYTDAEFLWPDLCETMTSQFLDGERIPGWPIAA